MKNNDYIIRATAGNGSIRAFFATTKNTVNEAFRIHNTSPVVSAAMGRLMTAAAIMGYMLKDDDIMTLSVRGDGPLSGLVATADASGGVKAYPYVSSVDIPLKPNGKLDVAGALGEGSLNVLKDIGLKEPYSGQIPLVSGEIAEDLTYYFAKSEQTPSSVALGVLVDRDYSIKQAGGFIIQLMPDADILIVEILEQKLRELPPVTELLEQGKSIEQVMNMLLGDLSVIENDRVPVRYFCNCTRERVEKALISVGRADLTKILAEDGRASLHCHFCGKDYLFDEQELKLLLQTM